MFANNSLIWSFKIFGLRKQFKNSLTLDRPFAGASGVDRILRKLPSVGHRAVLSMRPAAVVQEPPIVCIEMTGVPLA